jgi:hypothetical protein
MQLMNRLLPAILFTLLCTIATAQKIKGVKLVPVDSGWASNSVNAVIFRKNSLASFRDTQFIAFYDQQRHVVIGKRRIGSKKWKLTRTPYRGNTNDAHNAISIMTDGEGYLHISWDHHNNPLNYCRSIYPGSLIMTERLPMTGINEQRVSYPEFYKLPGGDLLFFYRNGESGRGNLVINRYTTSTRQWQQVHTNLVDGEGRRNAYWQTSIDARGTVHLSWVWRETPDVASNHDMCYARSSDGGRTWTNSNNEPYQLPITAATAEYACIIPQRSGLINQTSMVADDAGNPYIASYWKNQNDSIPQYHLVFKKDGHWQTQSPGLRKTSFSLEGGGTRRIPISRPQVITWQSGRRQQIALIFRDAERGSRVSVALCPDITAPKWQLSDLTRETVGSWEPSYDTELWREKKILHLFVQHVEQADNEGRTNTPPQLIKVLEWKPKK